MTSSAAGPDVRQDDAVIGTDLVQGPAARPRSRWRSRRLALGLSPTPRSGLMLVLVGAALGPHGLQVLSDRMLTSLDPAASVALAALGVLVGLEVRVRPSAERRLLAAASFDAAITVAIVAIGAVLVQRWSPLEGQSPWLLALLLGVCAAPSSTPVDGEVGPQQLALRVADLDDVLPIAASAFTIFAWDVAAPLVTAQFLAQAAGIVLAIALATRLLVAQTGSETEQRVFVIGGLLLLGGAAAHLSLSALAAGLLAGVFWSVTGGEARERIARDVRYLQHPLTVLLLMVAGARLELTGALAGVAIVYVALRIAGKAAAGWAVARVTRDLSGPAGLSFSAPGVVGIAIALNALQARGDAAADLFAIVVAGSLAAEFLSLLGGSRAETTA